MKYLSFLATFLIFIIPAYPQFLEVSEEVGIDHIQLSVRSLGGGACFFDYNNDGFLDLYVTGGGVQDKLYQNLGNSTFYDVSDQTEITRYTEGYQSSSVVSGDIDNDGCTDLLVTTYDDRRNILLRNNCNGTFTNIAFSAGLVEEVLSMGATLLDYNNDGLLDIYIVNYVEESRFIRDPDENIIGFDHDCSENFLYVNQGNNTFLESSTQLNVGDHGCGLAVVSTDINDDGYTDIYVVNDFGEWVSPNAAYQFDPVAQEYVRIPDTNGLDQAIYGMGVASGDFDNDMDIDFYVTNLGDNKFLRNQGNGQYEEIAEQLGVRNGEDELGNFTTGWGTFFFDFDNDSDLDLFVSNGFTGAVEFLSPSLEDPNKLYENVNGSFIDISSEAEVDMTFRNRGAIYGDYDNDGDLDVFVVTLNGEDALFSPLFENNENYNNNWVKFQLEGTLSNRTAYGTKVILYAGNQAYLRELSGGGSYASQSSTLLHFGLKDYSVIDSLEVKWPNSEAQKFYNLPVNQKIFIEEGSASIQIMGCMDPVNEYYNPDAVYNTGCSINYIVGCLDPDAENYNPRASLAGECSYENIVTSVDILKDSEWLIYPNPVYETIQISVPSATGHFELRVFDLQGKEVLSKRDIFEDEIKLNVSGLTRGIYFLEITNDELRKPFKFIKQ